MPPGERFKGGGNLGAKLNRVVDSVDLFRNLQGDPFISVRLTEGGGCSLSLNIAEVLARVPKSFGAGSNFRRAQVTQVRASDVLARLLDSDGNLTSEIVTVRFDAGTDDTMTQTPDMSILSPHLTQNARIWVQKRTGGELEAGWWAEGVYCETCAPLDKSQQDKSEPSSPLMVQVVTTPAVRQAKILYIETPVDTDAFPIGFFPADAVLCEIRGWTDVGTVTFTVERRSAPNTSGGELPAEDIEASTTGEICATWSGEGNLVEADNWLYYVAKAVAGATKLWISVVFTTP